jgi:AP-3 complex subunit beta
MISKSLPASNHLFPSVLKLTSAQSLQVKTLVYLVTLRLAPSQPDIALLSINSFQRDLSDSSPLIRGMSLRVLSGLGVKMAAPLMEMAIAKGVRDPSFYVRRIAADALGKCFELASSTLPSLLPHLSSLLGDRHPSVLGSALLAFNCTVPDRYDLLHPHFRRICHGLVDIDEWNQPVTLRVLAGYARTYLRRPSAEETRTVLEGKAEKVVPGRSKWGTGLDKDLELLLSKAEPLLLSRNSAVSSIASLTLLDL